MKELENAIREIRKPRPYYLDTNKEIADGIEQYVSKEVEDALMEGYERGKSETERKQEQYVSNEKEYLNKMTSERIANMYKSHEQDVIKARNCKSCGEPLVVNCRTCQAELKKGLNDG